MRGLLTAFALSILLAQAGHADPLADLRAALQTLGGTAPIAATATIRISSTSEEDDIARTEEGEATVDLEDGPAGLSIHFPKALLDRLEREGKATRAPALLGRLDGAQLVEQKNAALDGTPARLLVIRANPRMSDAAKKRVKSSEFLLRVWTGSDGLPLAAELTEKIHAKFLLMSFHHEAKTHWRFDRAADRLLVRTYREESTDQGFGQNSRRVVEAKLAARPRPS